MPVTRKELAALIKQSMDKDKENIIRLARSAGLEILDFGDEQEVGCGDGYHVQTDLIERFAALVAEQERERYEAHRLQQEAWNIDTQYASVLALLLECMILDPRRWHDDAVKVLDQYRAEWDKLNPSPSPFGKD